MTVLAQYLATGMPAGDQFVDKSPDRACPVGNRRRAGGAGSIRCEAQPDEETGPPVGCIRGPEWPESVFQCSYTTPDSGLKRKHCCAQLVSFPLGATAARSGNEAIHFEAGPGFQRHMAAMAVLGGEFQIHMIQVAFGRFVFDPQVGQSDLAVYDTRGTVPA